VSECSFSDFRRDPCPEGICINTAFSPILALKGQWVSMIKSQKMIPKTPIEPKSEIKKLYDNLLKIGKQKSVIDRCCPLSEVPETFLNYKKKDTSEEESS